MVTPCKNYCLAMGSRRAAPAMVTRVRKDPQQTNRWGHGRGPSGSHFFTWNLIESLEGFLTRITFAMPRSITDPTCQLIWYQHGDGAGAVSWSKQAARSHSLDEPIAFGHRRSCFTSHSAATPAIGFLTRRILARCCVAGAPFASFWRAAPRKRRHGI
jgi:hypothetical protein